ncbi:BZ3500_MvSof-1268-A1-R1_Chr1-3g02357 [Microbotryum saponariae]|uniref:BZ3500_MvSof-1268-A1-R1_Chr1-3g02357 protein n=1 Tax=Microbotryum saponariae TaxID=289078 RepID=A0A2X0MFZ7_9BASI|nr:BZ3500_MvSof-1268-A1-R1_Chr1-3g02357 [Microbotryum saponariae]SCZ96089.1 BZ3501_MvSof-1269-A2-R1_Chr1-3g01960 [Microbotryum saponariae]
MSLRVQQRRAYFTEPTKDALFREAFGLPEEEEPLGEVHAVLTMQGKEEAYSGKLYLSTSFLAFTSLDRRSCRFTLPLATVRRVEKLAPGQDGTSAGAFALSLTLLHHLRIVLQLNSLRPTNDAFCATLRRRLKASLPMMKALSPFSRTFFSEHYLNPVSEKDDADADGTGASEKPEPVVGQLISFGEGDSEAKDFKGKQKEVNEYTTEAGTGHGFHGGLGLVFKFPGDPRKLREKSKMKLWKEYLTHHGRNLTLVRYPSFTRLVLVGLPNRLRGEMWELTCGSMYMRLHNPGVYDKILEDNEGRRSASTDDIEKDLHRSLPEYAAYQDKAGIDAMRRVLTAYSWSNPSVGYCQVSDGVLLPSLKRELICMRSTSQAMNLIAASFLIYMSEEQCFWTLTVLCDRLLPGYYSPSMYGTVLDQRVFEHLVQKCLPLIHDHFSEADVQLSVASLPWFLSLYISSLPMVFAFRIIDCFFLMGPKVLFQVGLAILKVNGEELLQTSDDGAFINVLKSYFATLGDSAHPESRDPKMRQITKFQELFVVAFREFASITDETIASERKRFRSEVVVSIENFAKRSTIRNLRSTGRLSKEQLGLAYDHFQLALLRSTERSRKRGYSSSGGSLKTPSQRSRGTSEPSAEETSVTEKQDGEKPEPRIDREAFGTFLGDIASWARDEKVVKNGFHEHVEREPVDHALVDRIFHNWDETGAQGLSFQDVVTGLDSVLFNDLMMNLAWLFSIHDGDRDGHLTRDEALQVSESLLYIFRNEPGDRYLGSVSNLIQNLFEFAESSAHQTAPDPHTGRTRPPSAENDDPQKPALALATFRMCVLADPLLEDFFESDLTASWRLEILLAEDQPKQAKGAVGGWWGGIVSAVMTDENKERINRIADEVGKRLDIQTVEQSKPLSPCFRECRVFSSCISQTTGPSIGKLDAAAAAIEPTARDSLFSTSTKPAAARNPTPVAVVESAPAVNPLSAAAMRMPAYPPVMNPWANEPASTKVGAPTREIDVQDLARQVAEERTQFADDQFVIDNEGEEDADLGAGELDGDLMNQVDQMLDGDQQNPTAAREGECD